jgi:hypothetical protein
MQNWQSVITRNYKSDLQETISSSAYKNINLQDIRLTNIILWWRIMGAKN